MQDATSLFTVLLSVLLSVLLIHWNGTVPKPARRTFAQQDAQQDAFSCLIVLLEAAFADRFPNDINTLQNQQDVQDAKFRS